MGARLAVLLLTMPMVVATTILSAAMADDGCVLTPTGVQCTFRGTTTTTSVTTVPPLRFLGTTTHPVVGPCWFWSRYPPGLDSLHPGNDAAILRLRSRFPQCPTRPGSTTVDVSSRAWQLFRSWTLARPSPRLRPTVGITNLASVLTVSRPNPLSHRETLPDGRRLEVTASVITVWVDWGDGTPVIGYPAAAAEQVSAARRRVLETGESEEIEVEIQALEAEQQELSLLLSTEEVARDKDRLFVLSEQYQALDRRLKELYGNWEAALENECSADTRSRRGRRPGKWSNGLNRSVWARAFSLSALRSRTQASARSPVTSSSHRCSSPASGASVPSSIPPSSPAGPPNRRARGGAGPEGPAPPALHGLPVWLV